MKERSRDVAGIKREVARTLAVVLGGFAHVVQEAENSEELCGAIIDAFYDFGKEIHDGKIALNKRGM